MLFPKEIFLWGCLLLMFYFCEVVLIWDLLTVMLSSWGLLSCEFIFCEVVFLWEGLLVRSVCTLKEAFQSKKRWNLGIGPNTTSAKSLFVGTREAIKKANKKRFLHKFKFVSRGALNTSIRWPTVKLPSDTLWNNDFERNSAQTQLKMSGTFCLGRVSQIL